MSYWKNWAKADRQADACHLLPYHGLDVAAVVRVLLEEPAWRRAVRADADFLSFWATVHDIGKMSRRFQVKNEWAYSRLRDAEPPSPGPSTMWHVPAGRFAWDLVSRELDFLPGRRNSSAAFGRAAICHHGEPETYSLRGAEPEWLDGMSAVEQFFRDAWELFSPDQPDLNEQRADESSWSFAGLMVVADWLASGEQFRPWSDEWVGLETYWNDRALPRAREVVSRTDMPGPESTGRTGVGELFDFETPTPLQQAASEVELGDGPTLSILEDATGSGKTEAALGIASQLLASEEHAADGIYFALPTQATANQMHGRLVEVKDRLFDEPGPVYLAHGDRDLVDGFRTEVAAKANDDRQPWVADHQKLTLLAPIGVGTIDQAVAGILPLSHQSIRLAGLSRSVLIVDEVHAYDAYLNRLLGQLLEAHASVGGSAILLSATLPVEQRREFVERFAAGAGIEPEEAVSESSAFPAVTTVDDTVREPEAVEAASRSRKEFGVELVHRPEEVVEELVEASDGGCACWVRNTVDDAREAWCRLREAAPAEVEVRLFHSRFTAGDRRDIEEAITGRFGPESGADERHGQILVATQVVEQSLDLDFDHMVSDLAPVDLLVQRAGRMHRHRRTAEGDPTDGDDERGGATLQVLSPEVDADPDAGWYGEMFPKAQYVYANEAVVWLTAEKLGAMERVEIPDDLREIIEYVYGGDRAERVPAGLEESLQEANRESRQHSTLGDIESLNIEGGYADEAGRWRQEPSTRIGRDSVTLRLVRCTRDGELVPWADDARYPWRMSEIDVPAWRVGRVLYDSVGQGRVRELEREMPDGGRYAETVVLSDGGDGWRASLENERGTERLAYDSERGLVFVD